MKRVRAVATLLSPAERAYLERGRAAFAVRFPGQDFAAPSWNIRHLKKSGSGGGNVSLLFAGIANRQCRNNLPDRFAEVVKAYLAICGKEPGTLYNRSTAARWLWEALEVRLGGHGELFKWESLGKEDAERAEDMMLESGMKPSSVYRRCVDLQVMLTGLAEAGVIAAVSPDFRTPRQESADRMTLAGQEARLSLLPSEEAITALADVFAGKYALSPFEQLVSCIPALMFASGLRVSEPLQLTTNPVRKEGERHFLFYFKAKGHGTIEEKIPLSAGQAALAQEAVRRALELTRDARVRAKELVASPHQFPLPNWAMDKDWLTAREIGDLLGAQGAMYLSRHVETRRDPVAKVAVFNRSSLQCYLQTLREKNFQESIRGVTMRADGTWLPLDEALFICFKNAGHSEKGTSSLMVSLIRQQQVGTFLGGSGNGAKSVFERLGLLEKDGRAININSHQIRHYVTSKASGAGIADTYLVRWQRRAHEGDLLAYKHLTSEERLRRLREHIRAGRLKGDIAAMYFSLASDERDIFLESVVQAVHVTHLGFCVHDFNASPCPSAMNCVKRCGSYLFDTGDASQRRRLVDLQRRNERALQDALVAQDAGGGLLVAEWVDELKATDEGLRIILATAPIDDSAIVAPFEHDSSKYRSLD